MKLKIIPGKIAFVWQQNVVNGVLDTEFFVRSPLKTYRWVRIEFLSKLQNDTYFLILTHIKPFLIKISTYNFFLKF